MDRAGQTIETSGRVVENAGRGIENTGRTIKATGRGVEVGGKAAQVGGRAAQVGGKAAQAGGKALRAGGQQAIQAGARLSAAGYGLGAIVGVPIAAAGAVGVVAGAGAEAGGHAAEKGGQAAVKAGKAAEQTGKSLQKAGDSVKKAGAEVKKTGNEIKNTGSDIRAKGEQVKEGLGALKGLAPSPSAVAAGANPGATAAETIKNAPGVQQASEAADNLAKKADLNSRVINGFAREQFGDAVAQRLDRFYEKNLDRLDKLAPGSKIAVRLTPAAGVGVVAIVLVVALVIVNLFGGNPALTPNANPEPAGSSGEELVEAHGDALSAYRTLSVEGTVPWPITGAIHFVTTQHNTIHPYTLDQTNGNWPRASAGAPDDADTSGTTPAGPTPSAAPTPTETADETAQADGPDFAAAGTEPTEVTEPPVGPPSDGPTPTEDVPSGDAPAVEDYGTSADGDGDGFDDETGQAVIGPINNMSGGYGPFLLSEDFLEGAISWSGDGVAGNVQDGTDSARALINELASFVDLYRRGEVVGPTDYLQEDFTPTLPDTGDGDETDVPDDDTDDDDIGGAADIEDTISPEGYTVAGGASGRIGTGQPAFYTVEVEDGVGVSASAFAGQVESILQDHRSWASRGRVMQRIADPGQAQVRVVLASASTVHSVCATAGLDTAAQNVSCYAGSDAGYDGERAMINVDRWNDQPSFWSSRSGYRTYLINHEFGHGVGERHVDCTDGEASIMTQQTASIPEGCSTQEWPSPDAVAGAVTINGVTQIELSPDQITDLIRFGHMDRRFLTDDEDWAVHLAMWRMALEAIEPMVMLTDAQICVLPQSGLTAPQKVDRAVRCNAVGKDIRIVDPFTEEVQDREDSVAQLGREAVEVAWLYNEWGQRDTCQEDAVVGGIFPVPVSPTYDHDDNDETPRIPYYFRCDEQTNLDIAMVGHFSIPSFPGLITLHEGVPVAGGAPPFEWMIRGWGDGIFRQAAGNDRFPEFGPVQIGEWIPGTGACTSLLRGFIRGLLNEEYSLHPDWGSLSHVAPNTATLWTHIAGMPEWEPVETACTPIYPGDADDDLDRAWALAIFDAFETVTPELVSLAPPSEAPEGTESAPAAVRALYTMAVADAFISEDGVSVVTEARWGETSAVRRLANPAILLEVPSWTPAARPDFTNYVMSYALSLIGESCGSGPTTTLASTAGGDGADTSTSGDQLSWEEIAQIAYDAGFRGEDLVTAVALTQPESGRRPGINNAGTNSNGTIDYGLWQINDIHNVPIPEIYDPTVNASFAYRIYATAPRNGGFNFTPWSAFNANRHLPYIDAARQGAQNQLGDRINDPPPGDVPGVPNGNPVGTGSFVAACQGVGGLSLVGADGLTCPNAGPVTFWDDWGQPRGGGSRTHTGLDMFSLVGTPTVAVEDGTVGAIGWGGNISGARVRIRGDSGNTWTTVHMDSTETSLAPGMRVAAGQVVGAVGYTGNAIGTPPHNHTIYKPPGGPSSPLYEIMIVICQGNLTPGTRPGGRGDSSAVDHPFVAETNRSKCNPRRTCSGQY